MRGIGGWCAIPLFWLITVAFSAQWTIGVYMCADNGMNEQANSDIAEMMAVGSSGSVNIVVQVDYAAWDTNPSCRRYYIKKNQKELLADLGEVDMADSATLADFIAFLKKSFPARNYFLIIWDHGNGWRAGYGPRRAVVIDESHTHMMGVAGGELASALRLGKKMLGRKITVLGFDACLMGTIEVATEVMDYCDYLLASEGLVGWEGFPYDDFFGKIVANPAVTTEELLKEMCADYGKRNSGEDVCLSAIFLPQLPRVINRINALCSTLSAVGDLRLARERVQTFGIDASRPPAVTDEQIDFIHFWQLVPSAGGCGLSAVAPLLSALDSLIIANAAYGDYRNARGVAAWFPYRYLSFKAKAAEYQELVFADSTPWLWFLNNYYSRDDVKPTQPEILNHRTGNRNDIRLWWSKSYDLAPVTYILYRVTEPETVFFDCAADLNNWQTEGWTLSTRYFH
ncbi:MAG: clostripain-related cysteine peptidase, partial [candidate division WOR-3 bacterium]